MHFKHNLSKSNTQNNVYIHTNSCFLFNLNLFLSLSLLHHQLFTRCQNFDRLSFHYLVTGNRGHLSKMLKIAQHRKNRMSRYHNALYLGDIEERVRVLEEVGQVSQQQNKNNYIQSNLFNYRQKSKKKIYKIQKKMLY